MAIKGRSIEDTIKAAEDIHRNNMKHASSPAERAEHIDNHKHIMDALNKRKQAKTKLAEALGGPPSIAMGKPKPAINKPKPLSKPKALQTPTLGKLKMKMEDAELAEVAYEKDLDETKPVVVHGVKGAKSKPFKKKFRSLKHFEAWHDKQDGDAEVTHVRNEDIEMDKDAEVVAEDSTPFSSPGEAILAAVLDNKPAAVQEIFDAAIRERLTDLVDDYKRNVVAPSLLGVEQQNEDVEGEITIAAIAEMYLEARQADDHEAFVELGDIFLEMLELDEDELNEVLEGKDIEQVIDQLDETAEYVLDNQQLFNEGARFQRLKQAWNDTTQYAADDTYDNDRPERATKEFSGMRGAASALHRSLAHPGGKALVGSIGLMTGNMPLAATAYGAAAVQKGVRVAQRYRHLKKDPKAPVMLPRP